ncbi:MAG: LysE family translocator [Desulfovibrionaceae bacterium]
MNVIPFLIFVVVMTGTPGPGNLTMMAIGQSGGFRSALPFLSGTLLGCLALDLLVAFGLGGLFLASPTVALVMKVLGMAYMLYLAWKVLRMHVAAPGTVRTFTFWEGLLLHPTSPKSWAMAVVAFAQFVNPEAALAPQMALFVGGFFCGAAVFHSLWCLAGAGLLRLLRTPRMRLAANASLAAGMVGATGYAMFL